VVYGYMKSVLTRKGFEIFCQKFHIPEEVHRELPSPNQTILKMPTGKIGVYTRDGPTKVRVVEGERAKGEVKLMDSIVGRVVSLLPVAPAHAESELEASVNKLFDEGGSADQRNSATGDTAAMTAERLKRHRKKRPAVANSSGSSHPPKKLRGIT
nr:hypothetical protein [Tanacetum cinerariifolium]